MKQPEIVCLCGSTRFKEAYLNAKRTLEARGCIVMTVECFAHADHISLTGFQKALLDDLHIRKIAISDRVFVINPGGYIGASTQSEIDFALAQGKPVEYLEPRVHVKRALMKLENKGGI